MYDAIVLGAGPAGLSAALVLGRCRRKVLVADEGAPRNARSASMNCYLTRDGVPPTEFLQLARADLVAYTTVTIQQRTATSARQVEGGFEVSFSDGTERCRRLLLATGVVDEVPDLQGIGAMYGRSVHHCPYCDAYQYVDQPIAVYGRGARVSGLAMTLRTWSTRLLICTDGPAELEAADRAMLERHGFPIREDRVLRLEGTGEQIERVVFASGTPFECRALFFSTGQRQRSSIPAALGCQFNEKGVVRTGPAETTDVPGLFVAGDASKATQFVIVAAAEGAEAACAINRSLEEEDRITE
ncbi:MAG TPA: NAD(P)/FAD-dependent oxidoreductase [Gemmatimonadales bacterium]|jgi:thioredoxin reductase|nr:NAD(P)/FAD-dependent oxidoreductase [Gemmatimonadales bacterium]